MSNAASYDVIIVGAGLTGLSLAQRLLQTSPNKKILILEKSKSCGGRMATRRIDDLKFDHGAQFIKVAIESEKWIQDWKQDGVLRKFPSSTLDAVCAVSGITQLAKVLARDLNISYNCRTSALILRDGLWEIKCDNDIEFKSKTVVLTCPLPQTLEILDRSKLNFDSKLAEIIYSPAVVLLVEGENDFDSELTYSEDLGPDLFSICSQHKKGNSERPAWTIVMSADWSRRHFEKTDDEILLLANDVVRKRFTQVQIKKSHLKKWRYCRAENRWPNYFENPQAGLYLAGDAFGGASLLGALRSSEAVLKALQD